MQCEWKHQVPGIVTAEQAAEALFNLKQLGELSRGIEERYAKQSQALASRKAAEQVLEFAGVPDSVPMDVYANTLRERLSEYALNRMEEKTFKTDAGQVARRMAPDAIAPTDGKEQLSAVQSAISERIVNLLKSATLYDLLDADQQKPLSKEAAKTLKETPLAGLYRLKVEADTDSLKAKLKSGELKPTQLPAMGYTLTPGVEAVHITVK